MNISLLFLRLFFLAISIFFMTIFMMSTHQGFWLEKLAIGLGTGILFGSLLIAFDVLFKRFHLRNFNIAILGIFIGYLMGQALTLVFQSIVDLTQIKSALHPQILEIIQISIFLFGIYLGSIMTLRSADEIHVSIPFVKLVPTTQKKRDLLVDSSVLADGRILDVATTGLFDQQLILPRFLIKDLYIQAEMGEEGTKTKANRCLNTLKKLEALPDLNLRYSESDFPEIKEPFNKLLHLARLLDANLLTADPSRTQTGIIEGTKIISLHTLSNVLKPLMQTGELMRVKIQRFGKEPNQGVGYLEDGTMVVINGGGDYIGETIEAQVLSVKQTTTGRMIFCNAPDWQPV